MSLSQALNTSLSGLRATQTGMSLISSNIANAQTPGYVRKSLIQETTGVGDGASPVTLDVSPTGLIDKRQMLRRPLSTADRSRSFRSPRHRVARPEHR